MRRSHSLALLISLVLLGMGSGTALAGSGTPTKAAMPVTGTGNTATTGATLPVNAKSPPCGGNDGHTMTPALGRPLWEARSLHPCIA